MSEGTQDTNVQIPGQGQGGPGKRGGGDAGAGRGDRPARALRAARAPPPPLLGAGPAPGSRGLCVWGEGCRGKVSPQVWNPGASPFRPGDRKEHGVRPLAGGQAWGRRPWDGVGLGEDGDPRSVARAFGAAQMRAVGGPRPRGAGCPGVRRGSWRRGTRSGAGSWDSALVPALLFPGVRT